MSHFNEQEIEKIVRFCDGQLSPQEALEVRELLEANQALHEEYLRQKQVSRLLESLSEAEPVPVPLSHEAYWAGIESKLPGRESAPAPAAPEKIELWRRLARARSFWAPATAACLLLGFLAFHESGRLGRDSSALQSSNEVETSAGVSATTLESDTICIEWITYSSSMQDVTSEA